VTAAPLRAAPSAAAGADIARCCGLR
jgi:hypothetical protein